MRTLLTLIMLHLAACELSDTSGAVLGAGLPLASVAIIQRTPPDAIYSLITGKDCSVVRLDQGKSYCRPVEPPPEPPPFCTRSLGRVDCWQAPGTVPGDHRGVGDSPGLTPEQEANRTRRWP